MTKRNNYFWGGPAGFPHSSELLREARKTHAKRKRLEPKTPSDKEGQVGTNRPSPDPDKEYLVGGTVVRGGAFPRGVLPENARLVSPAPWRHVIDPSVSMERFARRAGLPRSKEQKS